MIVSNGKVPDQDSDKDKQEEINESTKTQLARRGAKLAFDQLSATFGSRLLHVIPSMWQSMAGGLLTTFRTGNKICHYSRRPTCL